LKRKYLFLIPKHFNRSAAPNNYVQILRHSLFIILKFYEFYRLKVGHGMKKLFNFLIYGNFFIAACAALQAWQTIYIRHYGVDGNPHIIFVFVATFFLYNIHKPLTFYLKKDLFDNTTPHDERTKKRLNKSKNFETPLSILTFTAGMISLECYLRFYIDIQWQLMGVGLLSMAYVLPIWKGKRLRDIPYLKVFVIAGVWAFVTVIFPLKSFAKEWYACDTFMIFERMAFILAITLPFDIRDMAWDKKTSVKTIPLSMGIKKTKILSYLLLFLSFLIACFIFSMTVYTLNTLVAIGISLLISAFLIYKVDEKRGDYFYYVFIDGMLLLQSVLVCFVF
jgi:4-hydroxybenzoate polyprenyltransferase